MVVNGRTPPCGLTVGEGGRLGLGWMTNRHSSIGMAKGFESVLAAGSALLCLALCDNV